MKFYRFAKAGLLAAGFLACHSVPAGAQAQGQPYPVTADGSHSLKPGEVLVPAALFGVSALFVHNGWLAGRKENVQDALSAGGRRKFKADDYSQYAPMAAVYGLNLCGVEGKHRIVDRSVILAMSYATMGLLVNSMKFAFREKRPDSGARNSFPSGPHGHGVHGSRIPLQGVQGRLAMDRLCGVCRSCRHGVSQDIQRPPLHKRRRGWCMYRRY